MKRWRASGLTAGAFAELEGVREGTLRHWAWQLARRSHEADGSMQRPAFVEIETASTEASALEIVLGDGKRIRVPAGFRRRHVGARDRDAGEEVVLPPTVRVLVCTQPQDMRRSFDTLAAVVREHLREEPQSGALYVFIGKRPTRVKILWWDRNGYCLLYKRLHRALFQLPQRSGEGSVQTIDAKALAELLAGVGKETPVRARARLH